LKVPLKGRPPRFKVDREKVISIFKEVSREGRTVLLGSEALKVAEAYGIPIPPSELSRTADEAVSIAEKIGYPVVMKIESPHILHKTDIGCVKLGIDSPEKVRDSFYEFVERARRHIPAAVFYGVLVQKMVPKGKEMIAGKN
jgi:acetyltransferase